MRTIGVRLRLLTAGYKQDTDDAVGSTKKLKGSLDDVGKSGQQNLDKLASKMAIAGTALTAVVGYAVKSAADFDKAMSEVGAVSNATADQLDQLRQAAIDAGQATVFSASDAAKAEAELAKAGVSTADILGGALTGSLSLAAAGQIDLADAATVSAAAMNTFGLAGDQVGHIADVLAAGSNKSAAGVEDLGQGLQQVGLVANQAGLSLEDTVGTLSAFADRGLKGSDGATSLKTALQRLVAPTDQAQSTLKDLGISAYDASGQVVSITNVAGQLQDKLKDLAPAQRNAALQTIFGSDAIRAATILYSLGESGLRDYISAVDDNGAAQDVARKKMDNLSGDIEQLKGSVETLAIQSGSGLNSGLRVLTQGITGLVNEVGDLPPAITVGLTAVVGLTGVTLLGSAGWIKYRSAVATTTEALAALGPVGAATGRILGGLSSLAGKALLTFGAVELVSTAVTAAFGHDATGNIEAQTAALTDWAKAAKDSGQASTDLSSSLKDIDYDLGTLGSGFTAKTGNAIAGAVENFTGLGAVFDDSLEHAQERLHGLDQALAQMVSSGHGDEAAAVFDQLVQKAEDAGISIDDLKAGLPGYVAAYNDFVAKTGAGYGDLDAAYGRLHATTDRYGRTADQVKDANTQLADSFHQAARASDELDYSMYALNGTALDVRAAQRQVAQDTDDLSEALKASHNSFDINTKAGRDAQAALDQYAKDAADAAQATYNQTGSVDAANATYQQHIDKLKQILISAGVAKDKVDDLVKSIANVPSTKTFELKVKVTGTNVTALLHNLDAVGGRTSQQQFRWGGVVTHAAQGSLRQANVYPATSPAMYAFAEPATRGEAFVPKSGDYGRSMSILSAAAGWYNADVVPRGGYYGGTGAGAGGGVTEVRHIIDLQVNGKTLRTIGIDDARGRGIAEKIIAAAWP